MSLTTKKEEKYLLLKLDQATFDNDVCDNIEKEIVKSYRIDGNANYIIDASDVDSFTDKSATLFQKISRVCQNESGILVLVVPIEIIPDFLDFELENATALPTLEEAIEAVFMNELENDFGFDLEDSEEYDD